MLTAFFLSTSVFAQENIFTLVTGTEGGDYHRTGTVIASSAGSEIPISSNVTTGSLENIELLKSGSADLAIVQRDVLIENYFAEIPYRSYEVILPLFRESLFILVPGKRRLILFHDFIEDVKNGNINHLNIGPEGSRSNEVARNLLFIYGVSLKKVRLQTASQTDALAALKTGRTDAALYIAKTPGEILEIDRRHLGIVTFSQSDVKNIKNHIKNLDEVVYKSDSYGIKNKNILSVGTWAFLVVRNEAVEQMESSVPGRDITNFLIEKINKNPILKNNHINYSPSYLAGLNREDIYKVLPVYPGLEKYETSYTLYYILLILSAGILILYFISLRLFPEYDFFSLMIRNRHLLLAALYLISAYLIVSYFLRYFENRLYGDLSVVSPFLNLGMADTFSWLITFLLIQD